MSGGYPHGKAPGRRQAFTPAAAPPAMRGVEPPGSVAGAERATQPTCRANVRHSRAWRRAGILGDAARGRDDVTGDPWVTGDATLGDGETGRRAGMEGAET